VQAVWRALVVPLFLIAGAVATFQAPETVGNTVSSLGHTVFDFITAQPQLASAVIIGAMLLLLSSSILPLIGAAFLFLVIFVPNQLTRFLPQLPSLPSVPSFMVPEPVKQVRSCARFVAHFHGQWLACPSPRCTCFQAEIARLHPVK
jgi:hypothetical protein